MNAIEIKNLTKIYKNNVIANSNINLSINEGEIFGILGPNGAGKTTLVKQIVGFIKPTNGSIKIFGNQLDSIRKIKNLIGYQSQDSFALWDLTIKEALKETCVLKGFKKKIASKLSSKLINYFKLENKKNEYLYQLSGGLLRLVSFLIAIIGNPKIVILDEPTSGMDISYKKLVIDYIYNMNKKFNTTILLVTHQMNDVEDILTKIAFINNSKIKLLLTPEECKNLYYDRITIKFNINNENQKQFLKLFDGNEVYLKNKSVIVNILRERYLKLQKKIIEGFDKNNILDFEIKKSTLEDIYMRIINNEKIKQNKT